MKPWAKQKQQGFTIVEVIIVIVVIAILTMISTLAFNSVQQRSKDSRRMSDIAQIAEAIDMYQVKNGSLPHSAGWCTQISNPANGWGASFQALIQPYLPETPLDPLYKNTHQDYLYYNLDDTNYYLYAELEGSDRADDGNGGCSRTNGLNNEYDYRYPSF